MGAVAGGRDGAAHGGYRGAGSFSDSSALGLFWPRGCESWHEPSMLMELLKEIFSCFRFTLKNAVCFCG